MESKETEEQNNPDKNTDNFETEKQQTIINTLPLDSSKQAIIVTVPNESTFHGTLNAYERVENNNWQLLWTYPCVVGQKGVSANRHEGDMTTPEGIYGFLFAFGNASNPGLKIEYRQTHPGDYWSALPSDTEYNTWVYYDGDNADERFGLGNYEDLFIQPLYKYAAALDYNYYNKTVGKGSAIFFHIAPYSGNGTAGCVALAENGLVNILKWLDPSSNPKICIGTEAYLRSLK